jgi:quercetin 2,3-dioxygenase
MQVPRNSSIKNSTSAIENGNVTVKVLAGESLGAKAVIDTITPIMYLHFKLKPGYRIVQPVPEEYSVFAHIIKGKGVFEQDNINSIVERGNLVIFNRDGKKVLSNLPKIQKSHLNYY